ncbi:MAG: phospholipid/cholesterol/gamma-HCH transport system substrate-binding protein [Mycobacterium sp.]|jgi:phospholipid/cholesterol/gamma-HCH transport system substrate-binding protein|nr:phospholipid/cholesterol/gamma-HCH transport system substrate-binding protein [Mycobacterium sp.]
MKPKRRQAGLHPALWTLILVAVIVGIIAVTVIAFNRDFTSYARVILTSDRAGLVMEPNAPVKFHGVQVGRVSSIQPNGPVKLQLDLYPDQLKYIPANIGAQITAPTVFGAKYVELLPPKDPSPKRLAAGAVVKSDNVSIEVNTVFQNLAGVLNQIDTAKLNAVLTALAEGFRGKGEALGEALTDLNQVLMAINPRSETIRADYRALKGFADTYSAAAPNLVTVLDAASTTSSTITNNAQALDSLLLNVIGLSNSGVNLIGPSKGNLVHAINVLEPTTRLLMKYNPELTCMLVGAKVILDNGYEDSVGGHNGKSLITDTALLFGDDAYRYPDNLPINGIKGGPGGAPGCGSLPDAAQNWPVRYLVTNSGWGTGLDVRPNPGIGFPGYADYFPTTRGTPKPPSIRHPSGPAPGPVPYPGAPPYGAQRYAPDGTPLYPGLPPAPPPGRPREPGPPPAGSEPFVPAYPGAQPTCGIVTQVCGPPTPPPFPPPPQTAPPP